MQKKKFVNICLGSIIKNVYLSIQNICIKHFFIAFIILETFISDTYNVLVPFYMPVACLKFKKKGEDELAPTADFGLT